MKKDPPRSESDPLKVSIFEIISALVFVMKVLANMCNIMFCVDQAKNLKRLVDHIPILGTLCYLAKYDETSVSMKMRKNKKIFRKRKLEKNAYRLHYVDFETIIRREEKKVCQHNLTCVNYVN